MSDLNSFYALEYSQYSMDNDMYPFHIDTLSKAIKGNLADCLCNNRKENKWQIIYIGTEEGCYKMLETVKQRLSCVPTSS